MENKIGRINDVIKILVKYDINMYVFSMVEFIDFGIFCLIVLDVEKVVEVFCVENFVVMLIDVVCISCLNVVGFLVKVLDYLVVENIFIEYMYVFV